LRYNLLTCWEQHSQRTLKWGVLVLHISFLARCLFKENSRAINLTQIAVLTTLTLIVAGERLLAKRIFGHFSPEPLPELHLN
jgi:hypothetical protein